MRTQLVIVALLALASLPVASAAPPEPACVQVYSELTPPPVAVTLVNGCTVEVEVTTGGGCADRYESYDLGTVSIESENTCHYRVRATAVAPDLGGLATDGERCLDVYTEYNVGPVRYVSPNSCTRYVYVNGEQVYPVTVGASAGPAVEPPPCYYVYREYHVGPVTVIQRSSCSVPEVHVDTIAVATSGPQCMDVYREYEVENVKVVQRNSCAVPEVYVNDRPVLEGLVEPAGASTSGPQCMPVYREYEAGPVKVVRPNSCSVEVYLFGEPLLR